MYIFPEVTLNAHLEAAQAASPLCDRCGKPINYFRLPTTGKARGTGQKGASAFKSYQTAEQARGCTCPPVKKSPRSNAPKVQHESGAQGTALGRGNDHARIPSREAAPEGTESHPSPIASIEFFSEASEREYLIRSYREPVDTPPYFFNVRERCDFCGQDVNVRGTHCPNCGTEIL